MKSKKKNFFLIGLLCLAFTLSGCSSETQAPSVAETLTPAAAVETVEDTAETYEEVRDDVLFLSDDSVAAVVQPDISDVEPEIIEVWSEKETSEDSLLSESSESVSLSDIPEYSEVGEPYVVVNGNVPFFTADEVTDKVFETYSDLDSLGRCGAAYANICQELMPTESRGDISAVKPTGWVQTAYDFVDGGYLYNRCHLIAHELAGEDANEKNLITGTRYFNVTGMLPFEDEVCDYVKETGNHVLYRVTPMFEGDNLVADGVLMEAYSVEDNGSGVCYCVFVYNIQPGVVINYATGANYPVSSSDSSVETETSSEVKDYILNTNSKKFHLPDCSGVSGMSEKNKQEYTGTREELIDMGYSPCGTCNP